MSTEEATVDISEKIREAYIDHILEHGKEPASVYKFAKEIDLSEEQFYNHYTSFAHIEQAVWEQLANETIHIIRSEEVWPNYSVREKLLAFYYTLVEVMKKKRSFLMATSSENLRPHWTPPHLKKFREVYKEFSMELINEGVSTNEIVNRPYLTDSYHEGLWGQLLFLLHFWMKDDSIGFEKTDAAIEKSVNLSLDLLGKGVVDSMVDFAKFMFQSK